MFSPLGCLNCRRGIDVVNLLYTLYKKLPDFHPAVSYWCLVGNGWEWGLLEWLLIVSQWINFMESILVKTRCPVFKSSTHSSSSPKFPQRLWWKILLLPNLTSFVIFNCRCLVVVVINHGEWHLSGMIPWPTQEPEELSLEELEDGVLLQKVLVTPGERLTVQKPTGTTGRERSFSYAGDVMDIRIPILSLLSMWYQGIWIYI